MQRSNLLRLPAVLIIVVLSVSAFSLLMLSVKPASADQGGGGDCSNISYSVLWVKQLDTAAQSDFYIATIPKGDDASRVMVAVTLPGQLFFIRISDGTVIYTSPNFNSMRSQYGKIQNIQLLSNGVASSEEGGYTAWVTASLTQDWLHVVCTGNNGHDASPTYKVISLDRIVDPTTHTSVDLSPVSVRITQNGHYIVIGGTQGYIAVFQLNGQDD